MRLTTWAGHLECGDALKNKGLQMQAIVLYPAKSQVEFGTEGRTRTDKPLLAGDFESPVSTNSTTPA